MKAKIEPTKHWKVAMVIGKLKILKNLETNTIWNAQKKALKTAIESPNLTSTFLSSVRRKPPTIQIKIDGQIDQWVSFEKKK